MTVREWMQKEKELKQWSQKAVLEMQNEYFEVIEKLLKENEELKNQWGTKLPTLADYIDLNEKLFGKEVTITQEDIDFLNKINKRKTK